MTENTVWMMVRTGSMIFIIICAIIIWVICVKRYFVGKNVSGNVVLVLKKPQDIVVKKLSGYGILLFMMSFRYSNSHLNELVFVSVGAVVVCAVFDFLPQKICEKGILVRTGFVRWDMIQRVNNVAEMGTQLEVILKKQRFGSNRLVLHCLPGMSETIEDYINQNI